MPHMYPDMLSGSVRTFSLFKMTYLCTDKALGEEKKKLAFCQCLYYKLNLKLLARVTC